MKLIKIGTYLINESDISYIEFKLVKETISFNQKGEPEIEEKICADIYLKSCCESHNAQRVIHLFEDDTNYLRRFYNQAQNVRIIN